MSKTNYRHLLLMAALSFISMYVFMYAMVDAFANVFANFNQFYMAGLMTAPMLIRQQAGISDTQFLRSMIPHHAGAVLMCTKAPIQDSEIKELCRTIISGQQAEIDQMKTKLSELEKRT